MTLDEIRTLLRFRNASEENCAEGNILLDSHIGHVAARIAELKSLEKELKQLRRTCDAVNAAKDCGILNSLATKSVAQARKKKKTGHVHGTHARSPS